MTLVDYLPILILLAIATAFAGLSILVASKTGPRAPSPEKLAPYECGIEPERELVERFPVKFYGIAMLFIIFDIEIILLLPYAVMTRELGIFGLMEMGVFLLLLLGAYLYIRRAGGLEWEEEETTLRRRVSAQLIQRYRTQSDSGERLGA
ncbi:MAG: NADH-quinone oxidoreductase subunit A [Actinomycetota bacterium]